MTLLIATYDKVEQQFVGLLEMEDLDKKPYLNGSTNCNKFLAAFGHLSRLRALIMTGAFSCTGNHSGDGDMGVPSSAPLCAGACHGRLCECRPVVVADVLLEL